MRQFRTQRDGIDAAAMTFDDGENRAQRLPIALVMDISSSMSGKPISRLNDALAGFVQSGAVDLREAFQRSQDRTGFLAVLQRQGIDTSSVERFG